MARKKVADSAAINFRCSAELKAALEDLAHLSRCDVSSLLVALCSEFVKTNKERIKKFRASAAQPLKMPTFATSLPKTATSKGGEVTAEPMKGGDNNAE